tara:strand:+ start:1259 stop:1459 length:201 start_codon:yes stop_codon:yes gene_type:complete
MILQNSEHITRYTVFDEGNSYIRLVEKSIDGENKITWMLLEDKGSIYAIDEIETNLLENKFQNIIQ